MLSKLNVRGKGRLTKTVTVEQTSVKPLGQQTCSLPSLLYMLLLNFILAWNFIFLCFKLINIHDQTLKQREIFYTNDKIELQHIYCKVWYALLLSVTLPRAQVSVSRCCFYLIVSITDPNLQPHETPNEERWSPATQLQQRRQQKRHS